LSENKTDVLIIGGGIAGCIAAISLVDQHRVTLVDKLVEPKDRIGESLAPAANRILSELHLLDGLESQSPPVFKQNFGMQSYWGSDQLQIVDHMRNPDGFVKSLDRKEFEAYLRKAAEDRGVTCLWGSSLLSSAFEDSAWKVHLRSTDEDAKPRLIDAVFVIDASGRQSHFARSIGVNRQVEDKLLACWVTVPNVEENTMSTISSCENGWWYSSVIPNGKRVIAFHTDSDWWIDSGFYNTIAVLISVSFEGWIDLFWFLLRLTVSLMSCLCTCCINGSSCFGNGPKRLMSFECSPNIK
jgi:flavin-dependent dehydrogenase